MYRYFFFPRVTSRCQPTLRNALQQVHTLESTIVQFMLRGETRENPVSRFWIRITDQKQRNQSIHCNLMSYYLFLKTLQVFRSVQ